MQLPDPSHPPLQAVIQVKPAAGTMSRRLPAYLLLLLLG